MEHLIQCVRRYPCLWNTTAIEYRDQELKDAAWAEVMKETDLSSVKEVKLKWKKLRDSYRDALKRQSETAAHPPGHGKKGAAWKYTRDMQFLQPYMNNRRKPGEGLPLAPPPPPPPAPAPAPLPENGHSAPERELEPKPEPYSDDDDSESSESVAPRLAPPAQPPAPPPGRKRSASPDPLETFFTGMCQATRRLPFPAQLRIKRALFEAVAAGEEALLVDHRRYAAAAAAAALWPRSARSAPPAPAPAPAPAPRGDSPPSSDDDDDDDADDDDA